MISARRTREHSPRRSIAVGVVSVAAWMLSGCPNNEAECPDVCEPGFVCDASSQLCVPTSRPRFEGELPARGIRVTSAIARVWTAALDPVSGSLVVTEYLDGASPDARVLTEFSNPGGKRVAIAASRRLLVVAWVGPQGRFALAYRTLPGDNARWEFATIPDPAGDNYLTTESFDLEVVEDEGIAVAFRDRDGTLRLLQAASPDDPFVVETIDDGGPADDGTACPDEIRALEPRQGVGFDPDLTYNSPTMAVAYHDADCGDLRFARRTSQRWSRTIVDAGVVTVETEATRGIVGRWPSLVIGPGGAAWISYHDVSRGRLLYARENDGRFEIEIADAGVDLDAFSRERKGVVGAFSRLSRAEDGTATVTYLDATSVDLKLARRAAGSGEWSTRTVIGDGPVGFFADHVVEPGSGRFIVAERLVPGTDGPKSQLVLQREDE